jgi:poly(3-hydroxybutyrate) depolymerase
MLYEAYEIGHATISPLRNIVKVTHTTISNPLNPFSNTFPYRTSSAACEIFLSATKRYGKPEFNIKSVDVDGQAVKITEHVVREHPFCRLLHFRKQRNLHKNQPKVLIVAPLSGHFATLLRGTVQDMLPDHDVFITDWIDARDVPVSMGRFDLDTYIDYIIDFCESLYRTEKERVNVMAVCQPGVPCFAAAAVMSADKNPARPATVTLMGSPIDTRFNPTEPNILATTKPLSWFKRNVILTVPWPNPGFMRRVYPGFLQLSGFMSMNMDRHLEAHLKQFKHLVQGDGESAASHREFYDEYLSVMDLSAEFYLQTIETVFQKHLLPTGQMMHRNKPVDPSAIKDVGILTIEGERDDLTGRGQTKAALDLCPNLPQKKKVHHLQAKVGHYGVFNGSRFRNHIRPKIKSFIEANRG